MFQISRRVEQDYSTLFANSNRPNQDCTLQSPNPQVDKGMEIVKVVRAVCKDGTIERQSKGLHFQVNCHKFITQILFCN